MLGGGLVWETDESMIVDTTVSVATPSRLSSSGSSMEASDLDSSYRVRENAVRAPVPFALIYCHGNREMCRSLVVLEKNILVEYQESEKIRVRSN